MSTTREALAELQNLGGPAAIAKHFGMTGVKGARRNSTSCPVTNYLIAKTDAVAVSVGRVTVSYAMPDGNYDTTILPPYVSDFVVAFDFGSFPELVKA